jgi:DUF1680 family protein
MKRLLVIGILIPLMMAEVTGQDTAKFYGPVVPNRVVDRYVAATYRQIGGYLGYRLDANLEKRLLQIDSATILAGFEKRPGAQTWIGEHVGKFLFSASKTYAYSHDARLRRLMDAMVRSYIACQLPDGYLGTYLVKDRWTEWDVWAHKYAIIGLVNYYAVTGYEPALEAAERAADLICRTFGDDSAKRDLMPAGEHDGLAPGSILEPMVDLYRYTADPKYLAFCRYILRAYEQPDGPKIISQLEKYDDVTKVGDAKAYEMLSCFLGILKYYKLTGEEKYLRILEAAWTDITTHRLYITGTASDHEIFVGTGVLKATNADDMGEGCVTVTWIQFNLSLLQITGETRYAEELERSVYNHLLAAENPKSGCVSYYTALQGVKPYRCDQGYSCCLSSVPRGISLIPEVIGGKIGDTFSVLLYENGVASTKVRGFDGGDVGLVVKSKTRFPADGIVEFEMEPTRKAVFTINFRVPEWAENFKAAVTSGQMIAEGVNGSVCGFIGGEIYQGRKGEMLAIRRTWAWGDRVIVTFDMPVEVLPGGISYPNAVAIKRGPQVLAIDKGLNEGIDSLVAVGHVNGLKLADASAVLPADWGWKEAFYLGANVDGDPKKVVLVPFAEAGQKSGEVAVWIVRRN